MAHLAGAGHMAHASMFGPIEEYVGTDAQQVEAVGDRIVVRQL